jgi:hypothetical protein
VLRLCVSSLALNAIYRAIDSRCNIVYAVGMTEEDMNKPQVPS